MIEWKPIDKNNPPEGKFLFFLDDEVYTGWIINTEERGILRDDEGYPLWETSESPVKECASIRFYAEYNRPPKIK